MLVFVLSAKYRTGLIFCLFLLFLSFLFWWGQVQKSTNIVQTDLVFCVYINDVLKNARFSRFLSLFY